MNNLFTDNQISGAVEMRWVVYVCVLCVLDFTFPGDVFFFFAILVYIGKQLIAHQFNSGLKVRDSGTTTVHK